jgi:hypothetical protein
VEELILRPSGSDPDWIENTKGAVPPVTVNGCEYGAFRVPPGIAVVTMKRAGAVVMPRD